MVSPTFYIFEYPRGAIGLLFKNKEDAELMKVKIESSAQLMKDYEEIRRRRMEETRQKKKEANFFDKIKGFFVDEEPQ